MIPRNVTLGILALIEDTTPVMLSASLDDGAPFPLFTALVPVPAGDAAAAVRCTARTADSIGRRITYSLDHGAASLVIRDAS